MLKRQKKIINMPIRITIVYLVFTLFLYKFGPFDWTTYHPIKFWMLQFFYLLSIVLGYKMGLMSRVRKIRIWTERDDKRIIDKLKWLIVIGIVFSVINTFRTLGFQSFDISGLIERLLYGIMNPGAGYTEFQVLLSQSAQIHVLGGKYFSYLALMWNCVAFPIICLSVIYFNKMSTKYKILTIISLFLEVIRFLAMGTNIGVFRILTLLGVVYYLKIVKNGYEKQYYHFNKKRIKVFVIIGIGVIVMLSYFLPTMTSRGGILSWQNNNFNIGGVHIKHKYMLFNVLPEGFIYATYFRY